MKNTQGVLLMISEDSFNNPFADYNANTMKSSKILEYWCSPFTKSMPISESDLYKEGMPLVFMGGRGTGKTMFLKYFSYQVQKYEVCKKNQSKNILKHLKERGGIGFYLRIDGPILRSFAENGLSPEKWDAIFTHYFELLVCKSYIEVIQDLVICDELDIKDLELKFVPKIAVHLGLPKEEVKTIDDVLATVESELKEVTNFRAQIALSDVEFKPLKVFASQDLSFGVAEIAKKNIKEFKKDFNFVVFIDEYENFTERQQRVINTLLKFVKYGITFRIGMRLEGFHTFDTVSENEFIKEGSDYSNIIFENFLNKTKEYKEFLIKIAEKRLESINELKKGGHLDISKMLGSREDLENEAIELLKARTNPYKHFELLRLCENKIDIEVVRDIIGHPENPLLEMLNILWVIRGHNPEYVANTMRQYLEGEKSDSVKKYRRDYVDKYKLSLMILLAHSYKKHKKYYSFNTFCYLSSGIVRNFIELCRKSFQYAHFENRDMLLYNGQISSDIQDKASHDLANSELEMITRIRGHGSNLYRFTNNLGNIFKRYHMDQLLRYPETNQFKCDISSIDDVELQKSFKAAIEWSIIQGKSGDQNKFILNHIFSPKFDVSYRIRGGHHGENYDTSDIRALLTENNVEPKMELAYKRNLKRKNIGEKKGKTSKLSDFIKEF